MRIGCRAVVAAATTASAASQHNRTRAFTTTSTSLSGNAHTEKGPSGSGSEESATQVPPPSSVPPPHRPLSEADRLARDIASLGKERWEAKTRSRVNIPAAELAEAVTAATAHDDSAAGDDGFMTADHPNRSKLAFSMSRVRRAQHTDRATAGAADTWTPSRPIPPPQADSAVSADLIPALTEVAFTLDEMEQTFFNVTGDATAEAVDGARVEESKTGDVPAATGVVTEDDVKLSAAAPVAAATVPKESAPGGAKASASVPDDATVSASSGQPVDSAVGGAEGGREEQQPSAAPRSTAHWATEYIPRCFSWEDESTTASSLAARHYPGVLLSMQADVTAGTVTIAPKQTIPSTEQLVASLSEALTWAERFHEQRPRGRGRRGSGDTVAVPQEMTTVLLQLTSATSPVAGVPADGPIPLQPVYSELAVPALERLRLAKKKELLLQRIASAPARGVRVRVVLGDGLPVLSDFVAELVWCAEKCEMVGDLRRVHIGFPSRRFGVLPSPTTLAILHQRVEEVMANTVMKQALLSHLHNGGYMQSTSVAPSSVDVVAALAAHLHTTPAAFWEELGLLAPSADESAAQSAASAWMRSAVRQLRRVAPRLLSTFSTNATASAAVPGDAATMETRWVEYCRVSCGLPSSGTAWMDACMAAMTSPEGAHASALYRAAMRSVTARTTEDQHHIVVLSQEDVPSGLHVEKLRETLPGDARRIAVVLDGSMPSGDKGRLLSQLRIDSAKDAVGTAAGDNLGVDIALVGEASELAEAATVTPLSVFLVPVGRTATMLTTMHRGVATAQALTAPSVFTGVFEMAVKLPSLDASVDTAPQTQSPPSPAVVAAQTAAVQFLQSVHRPFVLSSSGEVAARAVAGVAVDLCRVAESAPSVSMQGVAAVLEDLLGLDERLSTLFHRLGEERLARLAADVAREEGDIPADVRGAVTRVLHQTAGPRRRVAALGSGDETEVQEMASWALLSSIDRMAGALARGALCSAEDANLLSVVALSMDPRSGGLLAVADAQCGPRGVRHLEDRMAALSGCTSRAFESLPLLRWMGERSLHFQHLDEAALARARGEMMHGDRKGNG